MRRTLSTSAIILAALIAAPAFAQRDNRTVTVVCESKDGHRHRCPTDTLGQITLGRLLSSGPCIEGRTWGASSDGIWVDHGCRAEFLIGDNGGDVTRTLTCQSNGSKRTYCGIKNRLGLSLTREISRGKCRANRTWGSDRNGVWVSNGCRAEFSVKSEGSR